MAKFDLVAEECHYHELLIPLWTNDVMVEGPLEVLKVSQWKEVIPLVIEASRLLHRMWQSLCTRNHR